MTVELCRSLFPVGEAYRVIYADPPWEYEQSGNLKPKPYPTMAFAELAALPVRDIAAIDSCLFLWATSPLMGEAVHYLRQTHARHRRSIPALLLFPGMRAQTQTGEAP